MDPAYLVRLIHPISAGMADYTKGNRFLNLDSLGQMPLVRRIGNLGLTMLTKVASGYWDVADPTNGYTAIHRSALSLLSPSRIDRGYFFESSILIQLNVLRAVVTDIPIPARYGDEKSSLRIFRALVQFPVKLTRGLLNRIVWRYFVHHLNAGTIFLFVGSMLVTVGGLFGAYRWYLSYSTGIVQTAGTIALALVPLVVGAQMLLQALLLDVVDRPSLPLSQRICDDTVRNYRD